MIGMIKGTIVLIKPLSLTVDVHGVGYNVFVPASLPGYLELNAEITLFVYTLVREDRINLYGFAGQSERDLFEILLSVSGLGAHSAILLLSHFNADDLLSAVRNSDASVLTRIPGIGQKKAEKIIFELKSREKKIARLVTNESTGGADTQKADVIAALSALGFDEKSLNGLYDKYYENGDTLESTLKRILRVLAESR